MYVCVCVCVCAGNFRAAILKNGKSYGTGFLRYSADQTMIWRKPISKFKKNHLHHGLVTNLHPTESVASGNRTPVVCVGSEYINHYTTRPILGVFILIIKKGN